MRSSVINNGVTCSATAYCGSEVSSTLSSSLEPFKREVVRPSNLILNEGNTTGATIQVSYGSITPDLYCFLKYNRSCTVTLQARTRTIDSLNKCVGGQPVPVIVVKSVVSNGQNNTCGGTLSATSSSIDLVLKAVSDGIVRNNQEVEVKVVQLETTEDSQHNESVLDIFDMTVVSEQFTGQCKIIGDPVFFTFDLGKYDNMLTGEFILYRHKLFEVVIHGYFYQTGEGSSACGVAVRVGGDVVKINKCETREDSIHPMTTRLYKKGDASPMFKVLMEDDGDTIKVYLPTGAMLIARSSVEASMNIYINPSALDIGNIDGACGSFDGNKLNDLIDAFGVMDSGEEPDTFSNSWRVPEGESIYSGYEKVSTMSLENYCSCDENGVTECTEFGEVAYCGLTNEAPSVDITAILLEDSVYEKELEDQQVQTTVRRKRATSSGGFTYNTNPPTTVASPIAESEAETHCETAITLMASYDLCKTYSEDQYASDIQSCTNDIVRTGSKAWAAATVQSLQESCRNAISTNATRWVGDTAPTDSSSPAQLNPEETSKLCTNDCSKKGECKEGVCDCRIGFTGSDCSTDKEVTPGIQPRTTSVTCALNLVTKCDQIIVSGVDFLDTATCHLTPIIVDSNGVTQDGTPITRPAVLRNQYKVICELPDQRSYTVAISNSKNRTRDEAYFVVHQSCFDCEVTANGTRTQCTLKDDYCFIDDVCYARGEKLVNKKCQACNPSTSTTSWSPVPDNECNVIEPPTTSPTSPTAPTTERPTGRDESVEFNSLTVITVASCVAGLLLIFIIVFVIILVVRRRRLKAATKMSSTMSDEDDPYERVFNGSFGLRTDKNLTFYNPSLTPSYEFYDNSI